MKPIVERTIKREQLIAKLKETRAFAKEELKKRRSLKIWLETTLKHFMKEWMYWSNLYHKCDRELGELNKEVVKGRPRVPREPSVTDIKLLTTEQKQALLKALEGELDEQSTN